MKNNKKPSIYKQAQRLADITKELIANGKLKQAQYLLQKVESIFKSGTSEIKNAISNVYVFSVSSFMEIHHCNIKGLLPENLKKVYFKQINTSGL